MTIQDDTQGISQIESAIEQNIGQMVYPSKFFTIGLSDIVCKEERSILEAMC
jgi:hypothetical protein